MLAAARLHLEARGQSDTLTAHFEYPGRTVAGPAVVTVDDVKLGRQVSTLHLTVWQGGLLDQAPWITTTSTTTSSSSSSSQGPNASVSRRTVLAYANLTDHGSFAGLSLPTAYEASLAGAPPPPRPNLGGGGGGGGYDGKDDRWEESRPPASALLSALSHWRFFVPRSSSGEEDTPTPTGAVDMWVRTASGERITRAALPFVVDSFPADLPQWLAAPELRALLRAPPGSSGDRDPRAADVKRKNEQRGSLWLPTVVMNLEVKTALPDEGYEWLAVRVSSKQIKDGKFDMDVLVRDEEGEILALSHHVAMILSMERNVGKKDSKASL